MRWWCGGWMDYIANNFFFLQPLAEYIHKFVWPMLTVLMLIEITLKMFCHNGGWLKACTHLVLVTGKVLEHRLMGLRKHHWRSSRLHNKHTAINHHSCSKLLSLEIRHHWKHSTATKLEFREEYLISRTSILTAEKQGAMTGALLGWRLWWLTGMRFRGWFRLGLRWQTAFWGKLACCRAPQDTGRSTAGSKLRSRFAVKRKKTVNGQSKHLTGCLSHIHSHRIKLKNTAVIRMKGDTLPPCGQGAELLFVRLLLLLDLLRFVLHCLRKAWLMQSLLSLHCMRLHWSPRQLNNLAYLCRERFSERCPCFQLWQTHICAKTKSSQSEGGGGGVLAACKYTLVPSLKILLSFVHRVSHDNPAYGLKTVISFLLLFFFVF